MGIDAKEKGKYLEDLTTIRKILQQNEVHTLIEVWAFYLWGGLLIAGTILSGFLTHIYRLSFSENMLYIFLPLIVISCTGETIAWVRKMSRDSIPLFNRRLVKFGLTTMGIFIILIISLHRLIVSGAPAPGFIVLYSSAAVFMLGYSTYSVLYVEAFFVLGIGILLIAMDLSSIASYIFAGISTGITFITAGIITTIMEKKVGE